MGALIDVPREVLEICRAKINLFLDVVGRRHDGFHELVTVFHEIDLADELTVREVHGAAAPRSVTLSLVDGSADPSDVPAGPQNLAARAARALLDEAGVSDSVHLQLTKNIPSRAGLGGGSADAAGALRAVNRLLEFDIPDEDLLRIGARIGSDVPFLVRGGTALGRGRGELLEPLPAAHGLQFLLLIPSFGIATAAVFGALPVDLTPASSPAALRRALELGDVAELVAATHNALLGPALAVDARLDTLLCHARAKLGNGVQMTGSGSTLFLPGAFDAAPDMGGWPFATRGIVVGSA